MADPATSLSPDLSSDELWRCYNIANSKRRMDQAFESLATFLTQWVESVKEGVVHPPMISTACDRYGYLTPCMAFDLPNKSWLLLTQPNGLLGALQVHVDLLAEKLSSGQQAKQLQSAGGPGDMLTHARMCSLVLARVAGCRDNQENITQGGDRLVKSVLVLVQVLLGLLKLSLSMENVRVAISCLVHCVTFLHGVVDPHRTWQRNFMQLRHLPVFSTERVLKVPSGVPDLFVAIFNHPWGETVKGEGKEAWLELQLTVLHMLGGMLCSTMDNRELACSDQVCPLLLTLFDPREQCSAVQVLATKVFVKLVHVLHVSVEENQISVDSAMMLVTFLNVLSCRYYQDQLISPCIRMVTTLLDAVPDLLNSEECSKKMIDSSTSMSESLKRLFVEVGCYEKICEVLKLVEEEAKGQPEEAQQLVCSIFRAFSAVTKNCTQTRQDFDHRVVGHSWLFQTISKVISPSSSVLQEALNMVVEGEYVFQGQCHTVYNTSAIRLLFQWLPSLPHALQLWLAKRLHDMCGCGSHNKQRCCIAGLLPTLFQTLADSQNEGGTFEQDVEDLLIDTVEVLGAHSIRTGELKQLIGCLRPLESDKLPTYYYRLQKSVTAMADCGSKDLAPLHYFDLQTDDTYISIPDMHHFPTSSSLSFHMWVSLDHTHTTSPTDISYFEATRKKRRILYSFYTNGGTGFEAFFVDTGPNSCMLVVATVTKKEFVTLSLKEFQLETNRWYSVAIVYSVPKRPWGRSEVQIYIDGEQKKIAVMKTHSFSDNFTSCLIGFGPSCGNPTRTREVTPPSSSSHSVSSSVTDSEASSLLGQSGSSTLRSTALGDTHLQWGVVTNLRGLLSSFSVFSDALSASNFVALHKKGPNDLSVYQHKCPETYELGSKLFLFYHARAAQKEVCPNLSPQMVGNGEKLRGVFTGQNYITYDIKAVLGSLGGVTLLFPLLEQVALPVAERGGEVAEKTERGLVTEQSAGSPARWYGETEGVAAFLKLLIAMLSNSPNNQNAFFHSEGPATIAALLMKIPPTSLTVTTFQTVQELVELFTREEHTRADIYKHLIFDFRVWSRPPYSVRVGHIQYISNLVKTGNDSGEWRQHYGVQYIIDVIRVFYSSCVGGVASSEAVGVASSDTVQLTEEETESIRAPLLMILKYYLMNKVQPEEVEALMAFIAVSKDTSLQEKLLGMLRNLLTTSECGREVGKVLWEKGNHLLSLIRAPCMSVRLATIKIVSHLRTVYHDTEGHMQKAFANGSLAAAVGRMTEPNMSSGIILALTELCIAKDESNYTDYISHMDIFLSLLHLMRQAPLLERQTVCQLITSILHQTPEDIQALSMMSGWEVLFLRLLTPFVPDTENQPSLPHPPVVKSDPETTPQTTPPVVVRTTPPVDVRTTPPDGAKITPPGSLSIKAGDSPSPRLKAKLAALRSNHQELHPQDTTTPLDTEHVNMPNHTPNNETDDIRSRSRAFADEQTAAGKYVINSEKEVVDVSCTKKHKKSSLHVSTPWAASPSELGQEDVTRTVDIVIQTFRHILWNSTIDQQPWMVWGKFFSLFDQFEAENELIVCPSHFKQKLLSFLCQDVTQELKSGVDRSNSLQKLLELSQQLETFVILTYPTNTSSEDEEVHLLKLAHNFFPDVSIYNYSRGLQEEYLKMLMSAGIFDKEVAFTVQEIEISQSAIRILLGCLASGNKEYYVTAALRLEHMLKCPFLTLKNVFFIFSNLARVAQLASEEGDSEWLQYVASILRCLFSFNLSRLKLEEHLHNLPDPRTPDFGIKFGLYCTTTEWKTYKEGTLKTAEVQYSDVLMRWLRDKSERSRVCSNQATSSEKQRKSNVINNDMQYQQLLVAISELLGEELKRQDSADSQLRNELSVTLQRWRTTRRFFTGERGAWSLRKPESYLWKLDRTENLSRMRLRLARNYNVNRHEDASKLRDIGHSVSPSGGGGEEETKLLAKVTKRSSAASLEDEEVLLEQLWTDANSAAVRERVELEELAGSGGKEKKVMKGVQCHLIMLMDNIPGKLELTSKHLYFLSDQSDKSQSHIWYSTDFKIPLSHMREIYSRRYNMSRTAFEIFLVDHTNYFINFPNKKVMNSVYSSILRLRPPSLNRVGIREPARMLKESGLTGRWQKGEISNFYYLMQLNTISGRTYNDLNQYPVFPWVLRDYTSSELNLEDESVYRDFSRPVGIQNHALEENIRLRFEEFDDPTLGKFHFGSHYSNAAGVMHYLIRLEPFTSLHVDLQSGRFDFADRQFFSIPSTWANIYQSGTDQKELVPEFFYQPEFLKNINGLDLGKLQTGMVLNDVILPPWASSPEDFITKHMEALESDYVSAHLHEWIDLIFGYKQYGPEGEKACNIFNFYTYEENVNLDSIKDPKERRQIESIINNFGQTPTQLFTEPHPRRQPPEPGRKALAKGLTGTFTGRRLLVNLFSNLPLLKAHSVDVCQDPIVFVGTPSIQTRALLVSGNPEHLVTVNQEGLLNIHGWLPFSNSKNRPFTFQFDPNAHFDKSRWQFVGGPFAQDVVVKSKLFVLSPNNKYMVSGGHWDNSFRVHLVERGKLVARISHHNNVVTCMALDKAGIGDHLITGSRDTSCAIWKFGVNGIQTRPLQTLYGHDSEVLCVGISTELDLAISGAKDGTCLLHTVRQGHYIHTLHPRKGLKCEIHQVAISDNRLVVYSEDTTHRQRLIASVPPCIHLYTVNGLLLLEKELVECINAMVVVDKYLITGNTRGFLTFRNLFTLQQLHSLNLLEPIHCISLVLDHHSKVCTNVLVGLATGKLIIVSVKDVITQGKPGS